MVRIENDCVACDDPTCVGCQLPNSRHFYCDNCGKEEQLYISPIDDSELCLDCIEKQLEKVE